MSKAKTKGRFLITPYRILRDPTLKPLHKIVLQVIVSHVGHDGYEMKRETIAKEASISTKTVQRAVKELVARGLLIAQRRFANGEELATWFGIGPAWDAPVAIGGRVSETRGSGLTDPRGLVSQSTHEEEPFEEEPLKKNHTQSPPETQSGRRSEDEKIFSEKRRDEAVDGAEPRAEDSSSSSRQMVAAEASSTSRAREAEPVPDHATELELLNLLVFYRPDFRNLPNPGEHGPQVSTAWAKARKCKTADGLTAELTAMAVVDSSRSLLEALTDLCCDVEVTEGGTADGEQFARRSVEREA